MDLAQSALEDFVCSYFMFHDLSPEAPMDIMRYLPALLFVESHIYSLDHANEESLLPNTSRGEPPPGDDPFGPLRSVLRERGWLTPRIEAELLDGGRFWALERRLCRALAHAPGSDSA